MDLSKKNRNLNRYNNFKQIGKNSLTGTTTFLAEIISNNCEKVVIKQFSFNSGANWSGYKEIEREILILKSLDSSKGLPLYLDSFETDTGFALVYRYIEGKSLDLIIEKSNINQPLSLSQIKDLTLQLLEKLIYLQSLEVPIIHRDIKPENIILAEDGKVYLIDFGFSNLLGKKELSASSVVAGTIGFIPPEQFLHRQVSFSTDIYSLGVTLYCLLTGTQTAQVSKLIDSRNYFCVKSLKGTVSQEWINWLKKAVNSDPNLRFSNATEALLKIKLLKIEPETNDKLQELESNSFISTIIGSIVLLPIAMLSIIFYANIFEIEFQSLPQILFENTDSEK